MTASSKVKQKLELMKQDFAKISEALVIIEKTHEKNMEELQELRRIIESFYEHISKTKKNDSIKRKYTRHHQ